MRAIDSGRNATSHPERWHSGAPDRDAHISAFVILVQVLAAFLALELPGVGLTTVFSEAGSSVPLFQRVEGCSLIMCGLDHVLFRFSQIPFLAVMTTFRYRAYQTARRASLQKPQTVVPA